MEKKTHLVVLSDFAHELAKRLIDVDPLLRRRLDEAATKVLSQVTALCWLVGWLVGRDDPAPASACKLRESEFLCRRGTGKTGRCVFLRLLKQHGESHTKREGEGEREGERRTVHANLALVLEIALVGDDDDGERVLVLHPEDLLVERRDFFKRVAGGDRIDKEEALPGAHVLLTHRTVGFISFQFF